MKPNISVVIPTFCRPERILHTVNSVLDQKNITAKVEIIVLDNDPKASAKQIIAELIQSNPHWQVVYGHEPSPGVANARNAALKLAQGDLIAFLDDDQFATPHWLHDIIKVQEQTNADIVFGPVQGRVQGNVPHKQYIERSFSNSGPTESGVIKHFYGCGNSLFNRRRFFREDLVFNPATNEIGGEDCELYCRVEQAGAVFAWAASALVFEEVPNERATLRYNFIRAFSFGQGPTQTAWQQRKLFAVGYWMIIGLAQAIVYSVLSIPFWLLRIPNRAEITDRAAQGLGKLLWFKGFEPKFYGASVLRSEG